MPRTLVQNTVPGDTMIFVVTSHLEQIHRDNQGKGIFFSQESIYAIHFWTNRMHILGIPCDLDQVTEEHALLWNQALN
jgi:hypothetical protein